MIPVLLGGRLHSHITQKFAVNKWLGKIDCCEKSAMYRGIFSTVAMPISCAPPAP